MQDEVRHDRSKAIRSRHPGFRLLVAAALCAGYVSTACASPETDEIQALRQQLEALSQRLNTLEQKASASAAGTAASAVPVAPAAGPGTVALSATTGVPVTSPPEETPATAATFNAGPVSVTLGGYIEAMVVNRSRNEAADWSSNYNTGIPFPQSPNYQLSEFHLTARQSRFSALAQGPASDSVAAEGYFEADLGAAPANATNNESSGFGPRVRQFYADYQRKDQGWYLLFGQSYSLATQTRSLMTPRTENVAIRIDGLDLPGFVWTRVPQIRFVKTFGESVALGLSVENPALLLSATTTAPAAYLSANGYAPVYNSPGISNAFAAGTNITTDQLPDAIAKLAVDPGWGHYEFYGLWRKFRDRNPEVSVKGAPAEASNSSTTATSVGGSVLLPLVPKTIEFTANALAGKGVGRYGSAQLPDATLAPDGSIAAIKGYLYFGGLLWTPAPEWTFYAYGGREHADRTDFTVGVPGTGGKVTDNGFGYGSALFSNANCPIEGSSGNCAANTSTISQATVGAWWKFYQGAVGNFLFGVQLTNVRREIYAGVGPLVGGLAGPLAAPSTNINIGLLSFRYYPYQR